MHWIVDIPHLWSKFGPFPPLLFTNFYFFLLSWGWVLYCWLLVACVCYSDMGWFHFGLYRLGSWRDLDFRSFCIKVVDPLLIFSNPKTPCQEMASTINRFIIDKMAKEVWLEKVQDSKYIRYILEYICIHSMENHSNII